MSHEEQQTAIEILGEKANLDLIDNQVQWAWENWPQETTIEHYSGDEKPEFYPISFLREWCENENLDE